MPSSKRCVDFRIFAFKVAEHIEDYTVPQYGDKGEDQVTAWTAEDCIKAIQKYCARFGKNSREGQTELDLLKIAHFAQLAYNKLRGNA